MCCNPQMKYWIWGVLYVANNSFPTQLFSLIISSPLGNLPVGKYAHFPDNK